MVTGDDDGDHDSDYDDDNIKFAALLDFCRTPRTREEMMSFQGIASPSYFRLHYLRQLLDSGRLNMTIPDKPKSKNQKYIRSDE